MERKLLSLPSFFVLLLVAGIAFLAAPVVDVQATAPVIDEDGADNTANNADDGIRAVENSAGDKVVVTITFNVAVKVTTAGPPAVVAADGFGREDLAVTKTITAPAADVVTNAPIPAGQWTLTTPASGGDANKVWTVTVDKPTNSNGSITVAIATGASFEDAAADDYVADAGDTTSHSFTDYDSSKPTVTITAGERVTAGTGTPLPLSVTGGTGEDDVFQLKVAFGENTAFAANQELVMSEVSVATTMPAPAAGATELSTVKGVWPDPAVTATDTAATYIVVIDPADNVTEVEITVAAGAFNNAAEGNEEKKQKVTINPRPTVTIVPTGTLVQPVAEGVPNFGITLQLSAVPAGLGGNTAANLQESDITLTNGATLEAGSLSLSLTIPPTATVAATYTATVNLPAFSARKTPVAITVAAGAFEASGVGNAAATVETGGTGLSIRVAVPDPDAGTPTTPVVTPTGTGGALTSPARDGFEFKVGTISTDGFVVLARSPGNAGFTSAAGDFDITYADPRGTWTTDTLDDPTRIDIADDLWVDLRHFFVGREGGSIDLTGGPTGTKVRDLVISEVMWGNDNGLGQTPFNSQWIELYNTTGAPIAAGTWQLVFNNKSKGAEMLANSIVATDAAPVVDKLSTWRNVGSTWAWRIEDAAGGSHGQSGKSTLNSATSPGSPMEIVSMQRKIDYAKVEKDSHGKDTDAKNREEQLKGIPNGAASGGWEATKEHGNMHPYRKGTPGDNPVVVTFDQTGVPRSSVVFNEIANRSVAKRDWIELYNKSSSDKKINGWALSLVTAKGTDNEWFTFENVDGDDITVPAKGYLLIVNTDPSDEDNPLEGGYNVRSGADSERQTADGTGGNPARLYYVSNKLDIPNTSFLLVLRNGSDKRGTHEKIEDIAGFNPDFEDANINTEVWPLRSWTLGAKDDLSQNDTKTWVRDHGKAVFHGDEWKSDGGFTGLGIDRNAGTGNYTSGTPGYANNAVQNEVKSDGLTHANPVIISEIMFGTGNGRVPQWIELHNPSHTQAVNLNKWKLDIYNYHNDEELQANRNSTLTLPEVRIQPNQTVLIVSTTGRTSDSSLYPTNRRINVWRTPALRTDSGMTDQRDTILSSTGFYLRLSDPKKNVVDEVGNLDGNKKTNDEPAWALPGGNREDDSRSSMVRDLAGSANDGTTNDAWRDAANVVSETIQAEADDIFYGDSDDIGTPGYTPGGVLPVQLSSFYSKRNDAGAVIITWSTESELDNAGFNILRSLSRVGEFTRINAQLIPGAGTTGEKNTYTWTDTSARPNVVYYYQIEDVSLDGEHRTLRTTRLRGYVGAAGKATTIWGELKSRD